RLRRASAPRHCPREPLGRPALHAEFRLRQCGSCPRYRCIRARRPSPRRRAPELRGRRPTSSVISHEIMMLVEEPKFQLSQPPELFARVDDEPAPLDEFGQSILTTSLDKVINWARKNAIWPMSFGLP